MDLLYLGKSRLPKAKVDAFKALKEDLQIRQQFLFPDKDVNLEDLEVLGENIRSPCHAQTQEDVSLVEPISDCQPDFQKHGAVQLQTYNAPQVNPSNNVQEANNTHTMDNPMKYEQILELENFQTYNDGSFGDPVKSEDVLVRKKQPKKLPKILISPPDQFGHYSCEQCEYKTRDKYKLKYHVLIKHEGVSYDCDECPRKFSRSDTLKIHEKRDHRSASQFSFQCDSCGKSLETKKGMKKHSVGQSCTKCDFKSCAESLQVHMKTAHNPYFHDGSYQCDKCDYKTEKYAKMNVHVRDVHNVSYIKCSQCDFKSRPKHLKSHIQDKHNMPEPLFCDLCEQTFRTRSLYRMHKQRHHGERRIDCEKCGFTASSRYFLYEHKKAQHGFIKHSCKQCDAKFNFKVSLKKHHKEYHPGTMEEKSTEKYTCDKCNKHFSWKGALEKHLSNLCKDETFQCEMCDMVFSSLGNMRKHQRNICGRKKPEIQTKTCTAKDCCRNK